MMRQRVMALYQQRVWLWYRTSKVAAVMTVAVKPYRSSLAGVVRRQRLNKLNVFDPPPIIPSADVFHGMGSTRYFSKIDMSKGYWQIPVLNEDIPKTAFVTGRMPFGMMNSVTTLTHAMTMLVIVMDYDGLRGGLCRLPVHPHSNLGGPGMDFEYTGMWYEFQRFPDIAEGHLECASYAFRDALNSMIVTKRGIMRADLFGKTFSRKNYTDIGVATIPDSDKPAEFNLVFGERALQVLTDAPGQKANFIIHDTDYKNYSVVFSCTQVDNLNIQHAYILTRVRGVTPPNLAELESKLTAAGVDTFSFILTSPASAKITTPKASARRYPSTATASAAANSSQESPQFVHGSLSDRSTSCHSHQQRQRLALHRTHSVDF
ncbi:apolipoprotein d [Plakobranchus ocellatus]|uniref:Apolipoprotein d n=1 Tax=Plakobranchus ocellatus TaxID=259542 RepID=A0AAV4DFF3_9GAST|nr:apolipoprotein d [Plakobranchus ocellatus]